MPCEDDLTSGCTCIPVTNYNFICFNIALLTYMLYVIILAQPISDTGRIRVSRVRYQPNMYISTVIYLGVCIGEGQGHRQYRDL